MFGFLARQLDLMVGDDYKGDCDINDFMPITCSFRFTRILEDNDLADEVLKEQFLSIFQVKRNS